MRPDARIIVLNSLESMPVRDGDIIEMLLMLLDDWELRAAVNAARKGETEPGPWVQAFLCPKPDCPFTQRRT